MKKIFLFIIIAGSLFSLASCKKYLEADSLTNNPKEFLFSSEAEARKTVLSVYERFCADAFTSRMICMLQCNTDVEIGNVNATKDNNRRDIWSFETDGNNGVFKEVWDQAYSAINRANECEDGLLNISLKASPENTQYKQLLGEVKALRAFWYYNLVDCFGDVPFKVTPTRTGENFYLPRTSRDTILGFLVKDLASIESDMVWADQLPGGIEYISREAVLGMIARIALMRGGYWMNPDKTLHDPTVSEPAVRRYYYEIANRYSKKLVELKPRDLGDFFQVFLNQNKYISPVNSDMLFETAFPPNRGDIGYTFGVAAFNTPWGGSGVQNLLSPAYYFTFDTTDLRHQATCAIVSYNGIAPTNTTIEEKIVGITGISMNKWSRTRVPAGALLPSSSKGTAINWPVIRYADVLLMLAETENELNGGPTSDAQNALRKVRQRAFPAAVWGEKVDAYIASKVSKQAFFNAIVDERAWEFGGETLRRHDLIRWGIYGKKIAETRNMLVQLAQDAVSGVGTYANYPDVLYYKTNSDNTLSFLSRYRKPTGAVPAGYTSAKWLSSLWNTTTNQPSDYYINQYRGYTDPTGATPLRYIFPLNVEVVMASQGTLQQQYGY